MQTLTEEEYKRKYGVIAYSSFDKAEKEKSLFSQIGEAAKGGVNQIIQGAQEGQTNTNPLQQLESGAKVGAGIVNTAFSPLAPIGNAIDKNIVQPASKLLNKTGFFDDIANSPGGDEASATSGRILEDISNANTIAGATIAPRASAGVAETVAKVPGAVKKGISKIPPPPPLGLGVFGKNVGEAVRDIIPGRQNIIDERVAGALDLTSKDLIDLEPKKGYTVTNWMADNQLIKDTKAATETAITALKDKNYKDVRSEIANVKKEYNRASLPRYYDALNAIKKSVEGVPGLEEAAVEVENLMNKEKPTLNDMQRVKELLDDHFQLYRKNGDLQEANSKKGVAQMRSEIQTFIEKEVEKNSGADIRAMNLNVSTARGLLDAIENRSTRGITKQMVTPQDAMIGFGLFVGGSPILGAAYLFLQKLINSPSSRLKFARWLDKIGDRERKTVNDALLRGEVPKEAEQAATEMVR